MGSDELERGTGGQDWLKIDWEEFGGERREKMGEGDYWE